MRLAVDLDGVCYEWSRTARYMLRTYRGYDRGGPLGQESTHWDYIKDNIAPEDWRWLWSEGVRLGLFKHGHVVTDAIVSLQKLVGCEHSIHFVTHRPSSAVRDTIGWVNYHMQDIPYVGLTILSNEEPKSVVDADVLINDKPGNVLEWPRQALLFDRPWNRRGYESNIITRVGAPDIRRVYGWKGVLNAID